MSDLLPAREFHRAADLLDITVRSDGDGRTVEAYTAVFNRGAEIKDADGHYIEVNAPGSFDKTISERGLNLGVFYNHARTIYGTPDGNLSVPIGVPLEVRTDDTGVFTVTRYLDNPLADSVLDGIKQRAIKGYSYSGKFIKSQRGKAARGALPQITRTEIAMREYGPTVFPAFSDAAILGVRSVTHFLEVLQDADPEDVARLRDLLGLATPLEPAGRSDTTPPGAGVTADEPHTHSARQTTPDQRRAHIRAVALTMRSKA